MHVEHSNSDFDCQAPAAGLTHRHDPQVDLPPDPAGGRSLHNLPQSPSRTRSRRRWSFTPPPGDLTPWRPAPARKRAQIPLAPPDLLSQDERLRSIILNIRQSTSDCLPKFRQLACLCGFSVVRSTCMRYDCAVCADGVKKRRAKKSRKRLDVGRQGRPILYTVFTVPPALRDRFTERKEWRKLVRLTWSILRDAFGGQFGIEASHPHGDPSEGGDPGVFHPHMNFLWIVSPGRPSFVDVRRLRRLYCVALSKATGVPVRVSDVWHHYYKLPGDLSVRIGYVMRTFPGYSDWAGSVRWYGKYPKIPVEVKTCPKCGTIYLYIKRCDEADFNEYRKRLREETAAAP